jgi:hypothetical protein
MQAYKFEATPTIQQNGAVTWELCYTNPKTPPSPLCGDGSSGRPYPNITVPKGELNQVIQFKINGSKDINFAPDSTPGKFYPGPIWAHKKGKPNAPGVNSQLDVASGAGKNVLMVTDKNDNKGELTLHYQLNFMGPGETMSWIDPDITNGGKGFYIFNAEALLIGGAALVALLVSWFVAHRVAQRAVDSAAKKSDNGTKVAENRAGTGTNSSGG